MVDGTVGVYGNRGINNAGGPLVVRSIHVFLSEWQGRNNELKQQLFIIKANIIFFYELKNCKSRKSYKLYTILSRYSE